MIQQCIKQLRDRFGDEKVATAKLLLETYSHDWWPLSFKLSQIGEHRYVPSVVVFATSEDDVSEVLQIAHAVRVPVTVWGLGSSVVGSPLPTKGGIVLDLSRLVSPPTIDDVNATVTVAAGVRGSDLEREVRSAGFTLGHSPQSLDKATIGGFLATLASGQFSSRYGGIEDLVVAYTVFRADGTELRLEAKPRRAIGPDFRQLFLGSEGTLGVITNVTLKLFPANQTRFLETFTLPNIDAGITAMRILAQSGVRPFLVRFYDVAEARYATRDPEMDSPVLFLGTEGLPSVAKAEFDEANEIFGACGAVKIGPAFVEDWLSRRYDFATVEGYLNSPTGYAETIEVAANWSDIGAMYERLVEAFRPISDEVLGHFSHMYGQGTSLYLILLGHTTDAGAAAEKIGQFWKVAMETVMFAGGELSHHHGVGLARKPYINGLNPAVTRLARDVKHALDPHGILNPGKLYDSD